MAKVDTILIVTKRGRAIRAPADEFPIQKRGGQGIRGLLIDEGDEVATTTYIPKEK